MKLPTYEQCQKAQAKRGCTPLERFILNNEPAGEEQEKQFRDELQLLVDYVRWHGMHEAGG